MKKNLESDRWWLFVISCELVDVIRGTFFNKKVSISMNLPIF
jgi:hypothetical protein